MNILIVLLSFFLPSIFTALLVISKQLKIIMDILGEIKNED